MRKRVRIEAEPGSVADGVFYPHLSQQTDGDEVARLGQRVTQPSGTEKFPAVVFRAPCALQAWIIEDDGRIVYQGRGCVTGLEGRGIDKRLETRPRLPLCLDDTVEFTLVEIVAPDQRKDTAVPGVEGDEGARNAGHLCQLPGGLALFFGGPEAYQVSDSQERPETLRRRAPPVLVDVGPRPRRIGQEEGCAPAATKIDLHRILIGSDDEPRDQIAHRPRFGEQPVEACVVCRLG